MSTTPRPAVSSAVLRYPSAFYAARNPHAPAVARRVEAFLRRTGVIADNKGQRVFDRLDVAGYAGLPFPFAGREELSALSAFLTLWIFYDDIIEEQGEPHLLEIERAIRGDGSEPTDPCHRAFWDLGRRFRAEMSHAWMDRHTARFIEWIRAVKDEGRLAQELRRTGRSPLAREFVPVRMVSVGALPVFCWIEYVTGIELPDALLADPRVRTIERCATEVIAAVNELTGWSKDQEARWPNLVDAVAAEERISTGRAFSRVAAKHNARVEEMCEAMNDLVREMALRSRIAEWIRAIGHITLGLARWHERAPRYRTSHDLGGGEEARIEIQLYRSEPQVWLAA